MATRLNARLLCLLMLLSFTTVAQDRLIGLEGQSNFRDLGAYETRDGRRIKTGMIYRSGELPRLTDSDVTRLEQLGIKTVVNFLTPGEIAFRGHDRLPEGIQEIALPITGEVKGIQDAANRLVQARKTGDFRDFPPEFNPLIHEELVSGVADEQYRKLFEILGDKSSYPVVIHCSHGIHRTGTASALILSALDVPWETVREDYLLSNQARVNELSPRMQQLNAKAETLGMSQQDLEENAKAIEAFYVLQGEYIDASKSQAEARSGSIEGYLETELSVSGEEVQRLRYILVE